jgi:signal transduction histidine kinase/ligand-binding sensor domain-containing protein
MAILSISESQASIVVVTYQLKAAARCRAILLAVGWLFLSCVAKAAPQYAFQSWNTDNGLPHSSIVAILQTRDGYLWLATRDGLVRFDGVHFTVFNRSTSPEIASNQFTALYEDRNGALWIGTLNAGLMRYVHGQFTAYTTAGSRGDWVQAISGDESGRLWVLIHGRAFEWVDEHLVASREQTMQKETGISRGVTQRRGNAGFWSPDAAGLKFFENGSVTVFPWAGAIASKQIFGAAKDQQGRFWAATNRGAVALNGDTTAGNPGAEVCSPHSYISAFVNAPRAAYACMDKAGSLTFTDLVTGKQTPVTNAPRELLSNILYPVFYEDREGNVWIGTDGRGLYRMSQAVVSSYSAQQGLPGPSVHPVYQERSGAIWVSTWPFTLRRLQNGKVHDFSGKDGLAPFAQSIYEDRQNRLWVGAFDGDQRDGLRVFHGGHFELPPSALRNLGVALAIYQDSSGALWFGTENTVVRFQNGHARTFTTKDGMPGGVEVILEDHAGNLWLGSNGGGLARLRDDKISIFTTEDGLPANNVRSLYEDADGILWIGTYDGGLGRLKDGHITRITTQNGLFDNGVFQILEDAHGYFWMSSNRGIYRVAKEQLNSFAEGRRDSIVSTAYGKSDGMLSVECNSGSPAGIRAADGTLWFPTQDGISIVHPGAVPSAAPLAAVLVESVYIDQHPVAADGGVKVAVGKDNFEIHYTELTFLSPEQTRFKYKLQGLDREWVDAGTRRVAYYSHVPPGRYAFKVIAANRNGDWSRENDSFAVVVLPAFYQTWWFATICWVLALTLAIVAWRYRLMQLERAHARQQEISRQLITLQETERQRVARELHDSLGQHLVIIKNLALVSLNKSADGGSLREVENISAEASQALAEVKEISYNLRPYQLDRIGLTKAVEGFIGKISRMTEIHFTTDIQDIDGALPKEQEINFYRIVQESVGNILKHAEATQITVTVERDAERVLLIISDDGKGFTPGTASGTGTGGFGLIGISERVQMLRGKSQVISAPGEGTTIKVQIPIGKHPL